MSLFIDQEGFLFIPKVGTVDLRYKTLKEGKENIREKVLKSFRDVEISISLVDFRNIKVNLIGNVAKPSVYVVPGNTRLMDLILNSYGVLESSDIRNIKIIRTDGSDVNIDLLSYLRLGDNAQNPYLLEGDRIIVNKVDKVVALYGAVLYPATYEYVDGESVQHLIDLAGGYVDRAKTDTVEVVSFEDDYKTLNSVFYSTTKTDLSAIQLKRSDKVIVREIPEYLIDQIVRIDGFVKYPGVYKISESETRLKEVILNMAGGFLDKASLKSSFIVRTVGVDKSEDPEFERLKLIPRADMTDDEYDYFKAKSREKKGRLVVDFEKLFKQNDERENIILKRGDRIIIPELVNYVTVIGQVVQPGNIIHKPDLTIYDYIDLAGGFGWRAVESDVRLVKAETGEWIDADDVVLIEPGDIVWVPEELPPLRFWEVFTDIITVVGQVATIVTAIVAVIIAVNKS